MDTGLLERWLLPPYTALTVRVLSKWRLGEFIGGDKLPPQEAEFEVIYCSVLYRTVGLVIISSFETSLHFSLIS